MSSVRIIRIEKNINMTTMIHRVIKWIDPTITPMGKPIYQKGHGNESPSPVLKKMLESIPTGMRSS